VRGKSLLWIAIVQVLAKLGAITPEMTASQPPSMFHTMCLRLLDPSATALTLLVQQLELFKHAPAVPWLTIVGLVTVPLNIVLWRALWHMVAGDGVDPAFKVQEKTWRSRPFPSSIEIPERHAANGNWIFPSSMSLPRR